MTSSASPPGPHLHTGVYGAWLQHGRLVTVEKARGPYTGWLDLPGGAPEPGETIEQALRRELVEECGAELADVWSWHEHTFQVDRASDGSAIDFRHRATIGLVRVTGEVTPVRDVEDVARVVLLTPGTSALVTPSVVVAARLLGLVPFGS